MDSIDRTLLPPCRAAERCSHLGDLRRARHSWVRGVEKGTEPLAAAPTPLQVVLAYLVEKLCTYPDSLPLRHYDESRRSVRVGGKHRRDGEMTNRLPVHDADEILRGHRVGQV